MSGSENDSDWDEGLDEYEVPEALKGSSDQVYTMQSKDGMVTITPAGYRAQKDAVPPVSVPIGVCFIADDVSMYTSFDDFKTPIPLAMDEDDREHAERVFRGVLNLPPGRYLVRYEVDGEWQVDENLDTVYSLGNEYNALVVRGPDEENSDDDDDSDWELNDDELPEQAPSALSSIGTEVYTKIEGNMVTITSAPELLQEYKDLSAEEKTKMMGGVEETASQEQARDGSLQWDPARRQFVIAPTRRRGASSAAADDDDGETKDGDSGAAAAGAAAAGGAGADADAAAAAEAERKRRKKEKKKRKKDKKKRKKKKNRAFANAEVGGALGRAAGSARQAVSRTAAAEILAFKEEVVRREREWREAWILHELKTQEAREKEKKQMRDQWREEREQWINKIQRYSAEATALRENINELQTQLAEARSTTELGKDQDERERKQVDETNQRLKAERDQAREEASFHQSAARARLEEMDGLTKKRDEEAAGLRKEVEAAKAEESKAQIALEAAQREVAEAKEAAQRAEARLAEQKSDLEKRVAEAGEGSAAATEAVKVQLADAERQLAAAQKDLGEAKASGESQAKQLAELKAELEAASEASKNASSRADELSARADQLAAERKELAESGEKRAGELEKELEKARGDAEAAAKTLLAAQGDAATAKKRLEDREAEWGREKKTLEERASAADQRQKGLGAALQGVAGSTKHMRESVLGFKDITVRQVAAMKSQLEDAKKFMVQSLQAQSTLLAETMKKYKRELGARRKYFNMVQELRGNIRVFARCRPILPHDEKKNAKDITSYGEENAITVKSEKKTHTYEFDRVFSPKSTQTEVFAETKPLVQSVMDGYNVCIFAYGQTGSGKTHTMGGPPNDRGVNFRALSELFRLRTKTQGDFVYKISVSMLEIYNENIRDLLRPKKKGPQKEASLKIHKGPNGMYIGGLTDVDVDSEDDVIAAMKHGHSNRSVGVTNMNEHSSRSHSIVTVRVMGRNITTGITYFGKLHMIDLAGSERLAKSKATGARLKETQAINKSLSALGNVIEALQKKQKHIPYRDSKLTFLLQDSLGNNAKTLMFINVSPADLDADETHQSLTFATRARAVELGTAKKNVVGSAAESKSSSRKR